MKRLASSLASILEVQRAWAMATGGNPDRQGYLDTVNANLWRPMSERSRRAFQNGSGAELERKRRALHSSSALAVNLFEYWIDADRAILQRILALEAGVEAITFEAQHHTGLSGNPPNLDICLSLSSGHTVAIESKFCEWLTRKSASKEHFKPKYFPDVIGLWAGKGLPKCQVLAEDIQAKREHFMYLDAPQLLKHALGLSTQLGRNFDLYYLYFNSPGPESTGHEEEIARFESRVGKELRFKSFTYQELFRRLEAMEVDADYMAYLRARYFQDA